MKTFRIVGVIAFTIVVAITITAFINAKKSDKKNNSRTFAVVELFTSEGCSSCPPADELVAKIQKESKDQPVYILAYHVDYWNHLGWKDVFSSAEFSKRQSDYANYLNLQSVYTPQIVVDGKAEFVGSQEGTLRNAIRKSLLKIATSQLNLTVSKISNDKISLKYSTEGADKNSALFIAFIQKSASTKVERGENGGHTLSHVQIVRKLQKVILKGEDGETDISLPLGFDESKWEIVGLLQNTANGTISAASRVSLVKA